MTYFHYVFSVALRGKIIYPEKQIAKLLSQFAFIAQNVSRC